MRSRSLAIVLLLSSVSPAGAQESLFAFHSAFWVNLHHYLHAIARPGGALNEPLPAAATGADRDTWAAAVATYREHYGKRSLLFDAELVRVKLALAVAESGEVPGATALPEPMRTALTAAAPIYRRLVWPAHDEANRQAMAAAARLVQQHGTAISTRLAASYGAAWPSTPIRVDFVHDAGPPGNAYTFSEPTQVAIAATDPRHGGIQLLELLFHEASHRWDATLMNEIDAAAKQQKVRVARELWHALLFFNAGTLTADALRESGVRDFQMYADKEKLFAGRWASWRPILATYWPAFLAGRTTRQQAIALIVRDAAAANP